MYGHERSLVESLSGRPFVLLGVNNDSKKSTVKKAIAKNNLNWRSWYDGKGGPIVKDFGVRAFPTIMLIDHNGVIRYHTSVKEHRAIRSPKVLDAVIEEMVSIAEADGMKGGSEPSEKMREFVDVSGKHKIVATYNGFSNGKVSLVKDDEKEIKVDWKRLSLEDRQFIAVKRIKDAGMKKPKEGEFAFDEPFQFTDTAGNSYEGTFIALTGGKAIVWTEEGNQLEVPYRKLTDASKEFIRGELKRLN